MTVYATADAQMGGDLLEDAFLQPFDTIEEARTWLLGAYDKDYWDHGSVVFGWGQWGDCWLKPPVHPGKMDEVERRDWLGPYKGELTTLLPHQHPGSRKAYWVTPVEQVLVIEHIEPIDD